MNSRERREIKALTMACWWPSKITMLTTPYWAGIAGELEALITGAERRIEFGTASQAELLQLNAYHQMALAKAASR